MAPTALDQAHGVVGFAGESTARAVMKAMGPSHRSARTASDTFGFQRVEDSAKCGRVLLRILARAFGAGTVVDDEARLGPTVLYDVGASLGPWVHTPRTATGGGAVNAAEF